MIVVPIEVTVKARFFCYTGAMPKRTGKLRGKHSRSMIWVIIGSIVAILALALRYGPNLSQGVITCEGQECLKAGHFHAQVAMTICGVPQQFPSEGGVLSGQHTHKESGKVHWHSTAPVDGAEQALTISRMLTDFSIGVPAQCTGKPTTTTVVAGGRATPDGLQYSWEDGDSIEVTVD